MSTITPSPFSSPPSEAITARGSNSWGPYASAGDFKGNALIIVSILFCAVLLFLAFNSIIRFLLCASCLSSANSGSNDEEGSQSKGKKATKDEVSPTATMVFSKDTNLAGAAAECAICLSDFLEGDGIRVLPACNHGFHVKCVERWLALRCSCPTCRRSTLLRDNTTSSSSNAAHGSVDDV